MEPHSICANKGNFSAILWNWNNNIGQNWWWYKSQCWLGNICILAFNGKFFHNVSLNDDLYVPDLKNNLFSQGRALDKGSTLVSGAKKANYVKSDNITVATANRSDKLY